MPRYIDAEQMEKYPQYPVGTVLWNMVGRYRHGKVYWAAVANAIQISHEKGFLFDQSFVDSKHGNSWNGIGRNYYLSREECLANWGDRPLVEDDTRPVAEQEYPDPKEYGKRVIWRDNSVDILQITVGSNRAPFDQLGIAWHFDEDMAKATGNGEWLTLDELRDLIWGRLGHKHIIEVRVESPLGGVIHQVGNYPNDDLWMEHGKTRGYA